MKNYFNQTFQLTFLVTVFLIGISYLTKETTWQGKTLRKMDILQDIRFVEKKEEIAPKTMTFDSLSNLYSVQDSSIIGKHFEDYTEKQDGLKHFFAAIDSIKTHQNKVRIAFLGDSFVEGDILLGDMRDTLQTLWGGKGVGFVPMTSEVAPFRRSFQQHYSNWTTYGIVKEAGMNVDFGINGFIYYPQNGASVDFEGGNYFKNTRHWTQTKLFYKSEKKQSFFYKTNQNNELEGIFSPSKSLVNCWTTKNTESQISKFSLQIPNADSLVCYGMSLESESGFYLDNFSVRGNTGGKFKHISSEMFQKFDDYLQYDLIVVQLGLNAVLPDLENIPWYEIELDKIFEHLRRSFPKKTILLVGVADRGGKVGMDIKTMPAVPAIVNMQRRLAQKHHFLFWDMYHAMGGPETMLRFANQRPSLANKDYTHLTHEGGRVMGKLFAETLLGERVRNTKSEGSQNGK
jgi:lysophospholipase L1-like esterase